MYSVKGKEIWTITQRYDLYRQPLYNICQNETFTYYIVSDLGILLQIHWTFLRIKGSTTANKD